MLIVAVYSDKFLIPVGEPAPLEAEPTFVDIVEVYVDEPCVGPKTNPGPLRRRGRVLALVGTQKGTILIFRCDGSMGLVPVKEQASKQQQNSSPCRWVGSE